KKERELARIVEYCQLKDEALERRRQNVLDDEAFRLTTRLLSWNPDFYTMWNYRRLILQHRFRESGELRFVEEAVQKQPKSYWIWNHRGWTLETMPQPDWKRELKLVSMMLNLDSRNFHGWQYRYTVISKLRAQNPDHEAQLVRDEFAYTKQKIAQSFSNGSAWHYRAKLLPKVFAEMAPADRAAMINDEFDMVRSAFYTDPDDQSAWIYYRWWLTYLAEHPQESASDDAYTQLLRREADVIRELLDLEPDAKCKYPCKRALLCQAATDVEKEEMRTLLEQLQRVDPMREQRYVDLAKA
ncbi:hypothetical protein THASP1DRAFT_15477, partial [Thamnocephalis sphaerospora]